LEVWEISGIPLSVLQKQQPKPAAFQSIFIGLNMNRELLYKKVEIRVEKMIDDGLVDEVKHISDLGYGEDLSSLQTVGYKEVFPFLKAKISFDTMTDLIKQKTRNYAKRQLTWFRKDKRIKWFDIQDMDKLINEIESTLASNLLKN
jgi:tRNA dimethylallyltransferase